MLQMSLEQCIMERSLLLRMLQLLLDSCFTCHSCLSEDTLHVTNVTGAIMHDGNIHCYN